jgi:hypothetical protein
LYPGAFVLFQQEAKITLGIFSIMQWEINLTVIAALLTLVGYSVNDTIVVFDRVRENLKIRRRDDLETVMNDSINQTLSRTILTSGLTFLTVLALFLFGGEIINHFAFAMVVGIIVGTYSSIAIAVFGLFFGLGGLDPNFRLIITKPDNVPIVGLIFLLVFFVWYSMKEAVLNDRRIASGLGPEEKAESDRVWVWPDLVYTELISLILCSVVLIVWSILLKAPLEQPANRAVTPNPSKAPWYFLGLQELVSYSAFTGGIGIPAIAVLGLMLVPFLDREEEDVGVWFGGPRGRCVCLATTAFTAAIVTGMLAFTVQFGWLRNWFPEIPQIVITLINPGIVFLVAFMVWSFAVTARTNSTRMGALAIFTCFLVSFVILTYFATVHRGPNWGFYWSPGEWPSH